MPLANTVLSHRALLAACAIVGLAGLALAAVLPLPKLYSPLYVAGLAGCGLVLTTASYAATRWFGPRAPAGLALTCALCALAGQLLVTRLPTLKPDEPEAVLLGPIFFAMLQGALAVGAVFFALRAQAERVTAWLGLALALAALVMIGRDGTALHATRLRSLTVAVAAAAGLLLYLGDGWLTRRLARRRLS